ncbi:kelch repeat-containing protein [Geodermatophilus sp. SYSU D01180]
MQRHRRSDEQPGGPMTSGISGGPADAADAADVAAADVLAVPPAPTELRAIASPASVRLTWSDGDGAAQVTDHVVIGSDGEVRLAGPFGRTDVTGLVNGQSYAFTVTAVNGAGAGPASAPSVPVTPQAPTPGNRWALSTPMPTDRERATAVRLQDSRVLVVGGVVPGANGSNLSTCEVYDPATSTWTSAEAIGAVASHFGLTLLPDGRVLRTGGFTSAPFTPLATTELFSPATGQWTPTVPMASPRDGHTAVLLADGRVLVAGGGTSTPTGFAALASAELYDPATAQWSTTGSLATARTKHSATRLLDGRVLVVGGDAGQDGFTSAELYDPTTGSWTVTGAMSVARSDDDVCCPGIARLPSGDVLVAGGSSPSGAPSSVLSSAEVYQVATGTWEGTGNLVFGRDSGFDLVPLLDGRILIAGGRDDWGPVPYAELYDEGTGTWTRTNDMRVARSSPATALLADGRVLLAGGGAVEPPFALAGSAETFSST